MDGRRTAVVTGGGQGIGKAPARRLLERGVKVVIADADEEAGAGTARECQALGQVACIACDVSDEARVRRPMHEAAGFITGANFVVAGGMTRRMVYAE